MFARSITLLSVVFASLVTSPSWSQTRPLTVGFDGSRLEQALAMPVPLEFSEASLEVVVRALSRSLGLDIRLDERALIDAAIAPDTQVTLGRKGLALQDALESMLAPHELTWMPRFRAIYVTTPEVAEQYQVTRVYPAMDLVGTLDGTQLELDPHSLMDVIVGTLHPDSWEVYGGNGGLEWHARTGALVCQQTWQVHQQVEALLESLRQSRELQQIDWSRVRSVRIRPGEAVDARAGGIGLFHVDDSPWRKPRVHE